MTSPPHDASHLAARVPRHGGLGVHGLPTGFPALLTFWLDSPYQGFRRGYRCPSGDLTAPGSWSVHGRCATDRRRGTDLLAGHRKAHTATAGTRTPYGERADGGLRAGRPGAGEATPAHAPARLPSWSMAGVVAPRAPVRPAPHRTRALSQHRHQTDSPACGASADHPGGLARPFPDDLPPSPCSARGQGGLWRARGPARFTRGKAPFRMTSTVSQRSTRQTTRTVTRQIPRPLRPADPPAAPGRAVGAGQRLNIPAGGDRD
jgi:hypothetical protein